MYWALFLSLVCPPLLRFPLTCQDWEIYLAYASVVLLVAWVCGFFNAGETDETSDLPNLYESGSVSQVGEQKSEEQWQVEERAWRSRVEMVRGCHIWLALLTIIYILLAYLPITGGDWDRRLASATAMVILGWTLGLIGGCLCRSKDQASSDLNESRKPAKVGGVKDGQGEKCQEPEQIVEHQGSGKNTVHQRLPEAKEVEIVVEGAEEGEGHELEVEEAGHVAKSEENEETGRVVQEEQDRKGSGQKSANGKKYVKASYLKKKLSKSALREQRKAKSDQVKAGIKGGLPPY